MGCFDILSIRHHSKKSDKETQSPVLKLFKDMMQKEKHDPEKTNLLKSKAVKKQKKHSSKCKSDHKTVETSCSDRYNAPYAGNKEMRNAEYDVRTQSIPFQGDKRESWWFWGEPTPEKPPSDDTCSCVSCALKKIINTDYACIACLVFIFTISVIVAFLLVYKSIPCFSDTSGSSKTDPDRPKRKTDGLSRLRWDLGKAKEKIWNQEESSYGVPRSMDSQDLTSLVDADSDLFKILDSDVMNEIQNSEHLREFYKKLIKTDAQIRNLKKANEATNNIELDDKYKTYPERVKRSLNFLHKPRNLFHFNQKKGKVHKKADKKEKIADKNKMNNENVTNKDGAYKPVNVNKDSKQKHLKTSRNKRFDNTSKPEGFLIENRKVLIQYKPKYINRKSKCSHAPKESKSHENQLKHPFYQNTQRLDELLDKFLDKNLPGIMVDQFGLDMVFEKDKKCKHPKIEVDALHRYITSEKTFTKAKSVTQTKETKLAEKEFKNIDDVFTNAYETRTGTAQNVLFDDLDFGDGDRKRMDTTTDNYGLLMSVSTMIYSENNNFKRNTVHPPNLLMNRVPNARKLLQTDDMNEVMVKSDGQDEVNEENRDKRLNEPSLEDMNDEVKSNLANYLSPNWKGPMPLYPDELNSIIKQESTVNRVETPVLSKYDLKTDEELIVVNKPENSGHGVASETNRNTVNKVKTPISKDSPSETDEFEVDLNDMEYIEDYFRDKYDRLVEMAQAYSDYGVLDGKKIATEKKVDDKVKLEVPEQSIKLSLSGFKEGLKNSIFGRSKKGNLEKPSPSEGFRLELQPTSSSRDDTPMDLYKTLQKHIKVSNFKTTVNTQSSLPCGSNVDFIYTPRTNELKTTTKTIPESKGIVFSIGKKRSLKSVENNDILEMVMENQDDDAANPAQDLRNDNTVSLKCKREATDNLLTNDNATSSLNMNMVDNFVNNSTVKEEDKAKSNTTEKSNDTNVNLSDFFMMLSSWFSALDGVDFNFNRSIHGNASSPNKTETKLINNTVDMIYPEYDSDMIDNIGHRSRVLLSVEDVNVTVKVEHSDGKDKGITETSNQVDPKTTILTTNKPISNITENKTKSVVKRNADSNLIFWNDLYDDEYGVAVDHFENNVRDKHSIRKNDFINIPNQWFRKKFKNIADGIHRKAENFKKDSKPEKAEKINKEDKVNGQSKHAIYKRISRTAIEDESSLTQKTDFAALTANMKKICRKAAKDIELAKRVDVREVSKEGQVTSSLMQQLIRLMGDLVDYQVKQRTCRKLPPDLQEFLDWLTSASSEADAEKYSYKTDEYHDMNFGKVNDKAGDLQVLSSSERGSSDSRSDYLGTLQAVQALMQQYEDMGEDDKSKMSGVKEYLEIQLQYLKKQLPTYQDFSLTIKESIMNVDIQENVIVEISTPTSRTLQYRRYKIQKRCIRNSKNKKTTKSKKNIWKIPKKVYQEPSQQ